MDFTYEWMGEHDLLLRLGEGIDPAISQRVHAACSRLGAAQLVGLQELVPAYASVLLRWRPGSAAVDDSPGAAERLLARLAQVLAGDGGASPSAPVAVHRLPVCYGGEYGCDLDEVATRVGLTPDEVVARHCAAEYTVAMLGFAPGFAYLLGMDPVLEVPRRERPRTRVAAGSVGIGGAQTGIYPSELPGGWQLLGRTSANLFDPEDPQRPCLLAPGDRVRFEAVEPRAFQALLQSGPRA